MICLELLGMSRAGKTTQRKMLSERLYSERIDTTIIERPTIPFDEFKSLYHFYDYLLDFSNEEIDKNQDKDVVILDRGANDRGVILNLDYQDNLISSLEYEKLNYKLQGLVPKIDMGFLFMVPPEESLRRREAQKISGLDFSYLNHGLPLWDNYENLTRLYNSYSSLLGEPRIRFIDGLRSIDSNFNEIFGSILKNAK